MTGDWTGGPRIAGAAALAVERVNADKSLLHGQTLTYSLGDSGCSAKQGLAAMGDLINQARRIDAVIGPGCSDACVVTSYLSGGQNIPQISYSCTPVPPFIACMCIPMSAQARHLIYPTRLNMIW